MPPGTSASLQPRRAKPRRGHSTHWLAGGVAALAAVCGGSWLWTSHVATGELECGPADALHLSELPMHGFHVLQSPDAPCSDAGAASAVAIHVDGFVSNASLMNVSCNTDAGGWLDEVTRGVAAAVAQTRPLHRQLLSETGALSDAALRERVEERQNAAQPCTTRSTAPRLE